MHLVRDLIRSGPLLSHDLHEVEIGRRSPRESWCIGQQYRTNSRYNFSSWQHEEGVFRGRDDISSSNLIIGMSETLPRIGRALSGEEGEQEQKI